MIGRHAEAGEIMGRVQAAMSPLGLLSEDYETTTLRNKIPHQPRYGIIAPMQR